MALVTGPMSIAAHARFFRAGDSFTVPSNGTASASARPGSADTGWLDLGVIETWEIMITDEEEKIIWAPSPGRLLKKDIITTKQALQIKLTANELTPQAVELFFRTATNISFNGAALV